MYSNGTCTGSARGASGDVCVSEGLSQLQSSGASMANGFIVLFANCGVYCVRSSMRARDR